jgi:hypothetical protein
MRRWSCEPDGSYVVVLSSTEHPEVRKTTKAKAHARPVPPLLLT